MLRLEQKHHMCLTDVKNNSTTPLSLRQNSLCGITQLPGLMHFLAQPVGASVHYDFFRQQFPNLRHIPKLLELFTNLHWTKKAQFRQKSFASSGFVVALYFATP